MPQAECVVRSGLRHRPLHADWRDPNRYRKLLEMDSTGWAGEWLLRNKEFVRAVKSAPCAVKKDPPRYKNGIRIISCTENCNLSCWGVRCCRLDDAVPIIFWSTKYNSQILEVEAKKPSDSDLSVDFNECSHLNAVFFGVGQEQHLLFDDGARKLQVVVSGESVLDGAVKLSSTLDDLYDFETKPLSIRRLCCLYRRDLLSKSLYPEEKRSHHWVEMLRAWDALESGVTYREIAAEVYGDYAADEGWLAGYRSRVQRLVRSSSQMIDGGYLDLLTRGDDRRRMFKLEQPAP